MSHGHAAAGVSCRTFGSMPDGRAVHEYTLDNGAGLTLSAINLGGIVTSIRVPDRAGQVDNVVLDFASLTDLTRSRGSLA
jgi:aldose 1-epimerase